jgi:hypothetical protein
MGELVPLQEAGLPLFCHVKIQESDCNLNEGLY